MGFDQPSVGTVCCFNSVGRWPWQRVYGATNLPLMTPLTGGLPCIMGRIVSSDKFAFTLRS